MVVSGKSQARGGGKGRVSGIAGPVHPYDDRNCMHACLLVLGSSVWSQPVHVSRRHHCKTVVSIRQSSEICANSDLPHPGTHVSTSALVSRCTPRPEICNRGGARSPHSGEFKHGSVRDWEMSQKPPRLPAGPAPFGRIGGTHGTRSIKTPCLR